MDQKSRVISIRLTEEEYERLSLLATTHGASVSYLVRMAIRAQFPETASEDFTSIDDIT